MSGPLSNPFMFKSAAGAGGFYTHQIANSVRFDRPNASKLSRALGTATANTKWTFSTWVKFSSFPTGTTDDRCLLGATGSTYSLGLGLTSSTSNEPQLLFIDYPSSGAGPNAGGVQTLIYLKRFSRDLSAWQHIVVNQDTTQGTASDRIKFYINGELQTDFDDHSSGGSATPFYPSQNSATINDSIHTLLVGVDQADNAANTLDGYMAETYFIDGTAYAGSDFGETKNGVWIPKDASGLTFGTNGFYLKYTNGSDLGEDFSGNNNDYTVANISAHDQMLDSPTFNSSSNGGNFATLNPLAKGSYATLSEGNLRASGNSSDGSYVPSTMAFKTGKWYCEFYCVAQTEGWPYVSIFDYANQAYSTTTGSTYAIRYQADDDLEANTGDPISNFGTITLVATGLTTYTNGDIIGIYLDCDNKKVWFSKNGSFFNSGDPSAGTNPQATWTGTPTIAFMGATYQDNDYIMNFGQDGTFAGNKTAQGNSDDTGYGNFYYAPDTGFLAMCTGNVPVADAVDPAQTDDNFPQKLFNPLLYVGNSTDDRNITGVGFAPDWVWIKSRTDSEGHQNWDTTRGAEKRLQQNSSGAEETTSDKFQAFQSDGFQVGSSNDTNKNSSNFVAWNWRANGGTETTNNTGTQTSYTQTDPSGGFSIVRYAGTGSSMTVGHGLSVEPKLTIIKDRDASVNWIVYTKVVDGSLDYFFLNTDAAAGDSGLTGPNTSIWNFNSTSSYSNTSGRNYIMYNFADIEGYCKVGTYVGNGNADGTFVYTGFRPAWVMVKNISATEAWVVADNGRSPFNVVDEILKSNNSNAEATGSTYYCDFLSNGFKPRTTWEGWNQTNTFVYLAVAHNPFKYATAR